MAENIQLGPDPAARGTALGLIESMVRREDSDLVTLIAADDIDMRNVAYNAAYIAALLVRELAAREGHDDPESVLRRLRGT
jgi:hypothetical protein